MTKLTQDQETEITMRNLKEQPMETIGHLALLKLSELGISMNAADIKMKTEGDFEGNRYECKMIVTWKKIKSK